MAVGGGWKWDEAFLAGENMASYQYHNMELSSTAGQVVIGTGGSGPVPIGVLQNNPASGLEATVRILGKTKAWASIGTAIGYGDFLAAGSIGHFEVAAGSVASAIALEALASGSAVITVLLIGNYQAIEIDNTP